MEPDEPKVWFPAKRYGWGWGPPCAWQGWVILLGFVTLCLLSALLLIHGYVALYILSLAICVGALLVACYLKGEKPRWRWGDDETTLMRTLRKKLAHLEALRRKNIISESEFQERREKVLKEI